jgi:2-polyprenyl-3-methyl-5-hydroxy-6-metoxy-1,4-benzoquinol methylase
MSYKWDIEKAYATRSGRYMTVVSTEFINRYIGMEKKNILDIGGGSGRFAIPLADIGHNVTVLEPNSEALDILRKRNKKIELISSTFEEGKITNKFDIILAMEVIGSFSSFEYFLDKISAISKPSTILIISTKNKGSIKSKLQKKLNPNKHLYSGYSDYRKYLDILNNRSFHVIDVNGFNWIPLKVNSNSFLVPFFIFIEKYFLLNKWLLQSPELLIAAGKNK